MDIRGWRFGLLVAIMLTLAACADAAPTPSTQTVTPTTTPAPFTVTPVLASTPGSTATETFESMIWEMVWSPDGQLLAAIRSHGISLYARATLSPIRTIDAGESTGSASFSPDGKQLACLCGEGLIKVWDVGSGRLLKTLADEEKYFASVAFNPNGTQLAGGSFNGRVKIWDASGERLLFTLISMNSPVSRLAFSMGGARLLAGNQSGELKLWNSASGELVRDWSADAGFFGLEVSADGTRMATSNISGTRIDVWDVGSADLVAALSTSGVIRFALTADGQALVCLCHEGILSWDARTGKPLGMLAAHDPDFYSIAPSPDGKLLAVGTRSGIIRMLANHY